MYYENAFKKSSDIELGEMLHTENWEKLKREKVLNILCSVLQTRKLT